MKPRESLTAMRTFIAEFSHIITYLDEQSTLTYEAAASGVVFPLLKICYISRNEFEESPTIKIDHQISKLWKKGGQETLFARNFDLSQIFIYVVLNTFTSLD